MSDQTAEKVELVRDEYILITTGELSIYANLIPYADGQYIARVYHRQYTRLFIIGETSPSRAIGACRQWIADNPIVASEVTT